MTTLSEAQYEELCSICDRLLRAPDSTIERVANPWLHVLNEHPANLLKYAALAGESSATRFARFRSGLSQLGRWVKSRIGRNGPTRHPRQADVLFISHLLNRAQIGAAEDFYFGPLPELLAQKGVSSCVALIDHTALPRGFGDGWSAQAASRVVLADTLGAREELCLRQGLRREGHRLRTQSKHVNGGLKKRIVEEAGRHAVSGLSVATLRIHRQVAELVEKLRPKVIAVTFEGHAWEHLAFAAARRIVPDIRCVGYHHTVLFPRQHAPLRLLRSASYDPDVVLTAGDVSRDRFREAFEGSDIDVETMGIHRRQPDSGKPRAMNGPLTCLVIPDGIMSEVEFLFDFAIESGRQAPEIRFILRLHPVIPPQELKTRFPRFRHLPPNVEISATSLDDDFSRSRWALYRGSNAAIYAVIAGLKPFYLERLGEMSIDSLHELQSWKEVVRKPEEFVRSARSDSKSTSPLESSDAAAAAAYCKRYFMPANYAVFAQIVSKGLDLQ